jgi:group I intron endonuclease
MFGQKHSDEVCKKISEQKLGKPRPEGSGRPSQKIKVIDTKNNLTTIYDSISAAALALNIGKSTISNYLARNAKKLYKNQYVFQKL